MRASGRSGTSTGDGGRKMGPEESQTAAQFPERVSRGNPRAKIATGMDLPCLVIYQEQPVGSMGFSRDVGVDPEG